MIPFNKLIQIVLSVPKTIWYNLRLFPLSDAVKLPVFVAYDATVSVKGRFVIDQGARIRTAMIRIGFLQALTCDKVRTRLYIEKGGTLVLKGEAHIGHGSKIVVREGSVMELGDNFAISSNSTLQSYKRVIIGKDVQFSWDCLVMDSDTHHIFDEQGSKINDDRDVIIGDHVWIGCRCMILKGAAIPSETVIGACSLVSGGKFQEHTIIAGSPAVGIRSIGGWKI